MAEEQKPWEQFAQQPAGIESDQKPWEQFGGTTQPEEKGVLGHVRDTALSVAQGVVGVPEAAVGLADIPTGGAVGKFLENKDGMIGFRPKEAREYLGSLKTEQSQEQVKQFQDADGFIDKAAVALENPSLITNAIAESAPLMGAGGVAGRAVMGLAPKIGQVAAGAIGEGLAGAGSQAEQIRQETEDGTLSAKQSALAAASGIGTAAFGALGGKIAQRLGIGDVDTLLTAGGPGAVAATARNTAKSLPREVLEGAFSEGILEELPQSLQEQMLQNLALDKPWTEGLSDAAVMGILTGGVMGAGAAPFHRPAGQEQDTAPVAEPTSGDVLPPQEPTHGPLPALPAPVYTVGEDGTVRTTADLNTAMQAQNQAEAERLDRIRRGEVVDVTPIPTAQKPSEQMGLDPAAGPLSSAAVTAVDSGASDQLAQQAALKQAAEIAQKQAGKKGVAEPEQPGLFAQASTVDQVTGEITSQRQPSDQATAIQDRLGYLNQMGRMNGWDAGMVAERDSLKAQLAQLQPDPAAQESSSVTNEESASVTPATSASQVTNAPQEVPGVTNRGTATVTQGNPSSQVTNGVQPTASEIKAITAKQIPQMSDVELQIAANHYGPEHKRTAKLQKEMQRRGVQPAQPEAVNAKPQAAQAQTPPNQVAAAGAASAQATAPAPLDAGSRWERMTSEQRAAVLNQDGGWSTGKGSLSVIGKRLAKTDWTKIAPGTRLTIHKLMAKAEAGQRQTEIDTAAHAAATSPQNNLPEPTQAQKEAGNYQKGHINLQGLNITVENPRGSERSGKREDGSTWSHTMSDHYGYIKRTVGADSEQVDVYVGPQPESDRVFVVDQLDQKTGQFDEHKAMLGFMDEASATDAYRSNFDKGWKVGPVRSMSMGEFKAWLKDGDTASPASEAPQIQERKGDRRRESRGTPDRRLATPHDIAAQEFRAVAAEAGLTEEQIQKVAPRAKMDSTTGWFDLQGDTPLRDRMIAEAQNMIEQHGGTARFVSMDLMNLGGLNAFRNNIADAANADYRAIANIVKEEITGISPDALFMRTGGDELAAIVPDASQDQIDTAMGRAWDRIEAYAREQGFADIKHAKGKPTSGVNIYHGSASIEPGMTPALVANEADEFMDASKKLHENAAKGVAENVTRSAVDKVGTGTSDREIGERDSGRNPQARRENARQEQGGRGSVQGQEEAGKPVRKSRQSSIPAPKQDARRWNDATISERERQVEAAGVKGIFAVRMAERRWEKLPKELQEKIAAQWKPEEPAITEESSPVRNEYQAATGRRVVVNRIGADGLTDEERAAAQKQEQPQAQAKAQSPNGSPNKASVIDNRDANKGEYIVRGADGRTNLARFEIGRNGEPVRVKYFHEATATRQEADAAISGFMKGRKSEIDRMWSPDETAIGEEPQKPESAPEQNTEEAQQGRFSNNKLFTEDKVAAARARMKSKFGQLNSGIDPEMLVDGMTIAGAYIESGIRSFSQYSKAMIEDLGDGVKPYLLSFWEAARNYPGLNTAGMTTAEESQRLHQELLTPKDKSTVAVGKVANKPAARSKKTGARGDMVLTQDWGVEDINGYGDSTRETGNDTKDAFLKEARNYLNAVADRLRAFGFEPHKDGKGKEEKPVRVNESGMAGSGDVTLTMHNPDTGQNAYIHIGDSALRGVVPMTTSGIAIMYRLGAGDRYATKAVNTWAPVDLSANDLAQLVVGAARANMESEATATTEESTNANPEQRGRAADQGRAPEVSGRGGRDNGSSTRTDTGNLEGQQPQDVPPAENARSAGGDGIRVPDADVGGKGQTDIFGDAGNGRTRAGRTRPADAGAGERSSVKNPESVSPANPGPGNFHIENPLEIVGGGQVARFDKNRSAIELLSKIREESRQATAEEQRVLAGYTGWGSFGQELFQGTWDRPMPKSGWEARDSWLRDHLGKDEWEAAQNSIINAHYTDPPTVMAMWDMVRRMGFTGGRVLEPSMGIGNFFGMMPLDLKTRSQLAGIELDSLTGSMAQLLYPDANIKIMGYQESKTPDNFYDVVIGNWPFANFSIADRRYNTLNPFVHDYFFLKAVDQVRPGGLVVGITSSGTMDKRETRIRAALAKKAELVTSIRLPSGAFEEYAGTKVVTDIIILKKREQALSLTPNDPWLNSVAYKTPSGEEVHINEFYVKNPGNVIGVTDFGHGTTRGRAGMIVHRPENMAERLKEAVSLVPENAISRENRTKHISYITNHTADREGSLTEQGGQLYVVRGEHLAPAHEVRKYQVKSPQETANREQQLQALIDMRRKYAALIEADRTGNAETQRADLRKAFEAFEKKHGALGDSFGLDYLGKIDDPFYPALAALSVNGKPAAILRESTMRGAVTIENPTIQDAYVLARNKSVQPSVAEIAAIAGKSEAAVRESLVRSGAVFEAPNGDVVPSDIYLSGNVRQKLREAKAALQEGNKAMERNVAELEKVVPADIPYFNIESQLGATWVPAKVYAEYVAHMLNRPNANGIEVTFINGRWKARLPESANNSPEARTGFGTAEYPFSKLVNAALTNQTVKIRRKDSDGTEYVDTEATAETNARIGEIRGRFAEWLWSDPERRSELEQEYNEVRNAYATPKYDGSFLSFEGMALSLGTGPFNLRGHQANAIWRALVNRRSINAHEVGTGKTYTMGGIAVESRRYGIAKKPMILAHNANSASVAHEIQMMYPAAKILYVDNLSKDTIAVKMRQIANDDWDAIVLPHSLLDRLSFKEETLMAMAQDDIKALEEEAYAAAQEDGVEITPEMLTDEDELKKLRSVTAKELVKARNRIIETIRKQAQQSSREDFVPFEDLGIDMVLVDEVHEFKKPPISTRMNMKGLNTQTSNRSIALQFVTRYIRANNFGGNVHTFTGTPITNTMTEIYHQMKYVMEDEMKAAGVESWDGWFGSFAKEVQDVELSAAGEYETITRLAGFINVPELRRMIGQYMDVVFADDMPEMRPREVNGKTLTSPDLTESERAQLLNGRTEDAKDRPYKKVINVTSDLTPEQSRIFAELQGYARDWRNMTGRERKEAMAAGSPESPIITEGLANKASFDVRLTEDERWAGQEGSAPDDPGSKSSKLVANVLEIYNSDKRAAQVIFSEMGYSTSQKRSTGRNAAGDKTYRTVKTFSTMRDVVERLVQGGIPREQIAVVDGSTSKEKRKEIADGMNSLRIRVVIGSTDTLGVGVNMQRNLRAMHHMDAPYMPGELEQRNGRGLRQGNQWNTVLEYRYMTDRLDGRRWQILAIKQRFINAFMKANNASRVIEGDAASDEESDILQSFSEAAGDPRILIRAKLQKNVEALQQAERMHTNGVADARRALREARQEIDYNRSVLKQMTGNNLPERLREMVSAQVDDFRMTIDGQRFDVRKDAEEAIDKFMRSDMRMDRTGVPLGSYRDQPITARWLPLSDRPEIVMNVDGQEFVSTSLRGMEQLVRNYPQRIAKVEANIAQREGSLDRLEEVANAPFSRATDLENAQKRLTALERDIEMNPVPPPAWLRSGAPIDSAAYRDGKEFVVTGHRWTSEGWFVLGQDAKGEMSVPYMEVTDAQGMPLYEEHDFHAPEVIQRGDKPEEGAATDGGEQVSFSKSGQAGKGPITRANIADAVGAMFPGLAKDVKTMLTRGDQSKRGGLVVIDSADPAEIAKVFTVKTESSMARAQKLFSTAGSVAGFFDPKTGLTFLVGPNLDMVTGPAVLLHEMTHGQDRKAMNQMGLDMLARRNRFTNPELRAFLNRVAARIESVGETGNIKEVVAYIVEQAVIEGKHQGFALADSRFLAWVDQNIGRSVGDLLRRFLKGVRQWLLRHGLPLHDITIDEFVEYAKAGVAKAARGEVVGSLRHALLSQPEKAPTEKQFISQFAMHIDLRGRASGKSLENRDSILRDGFQQSFNVNAMPAYPLPSKGFGSQLKPKVGDVVYFAPKGQWKDTPNGLRIENGWKPRSYEAVVVTPENEGMTPYQMYMDARKKEESALLSQADQTNTPAFKRWFGDSKVVDENGKPLVVYHGTNSKFNVFDMGKSADGAHFFTANEKHAASFGAAKPFYVSINNPLEITQTDLEKAWDAEHPDGEQDDRYLLPRDFVVEFVEMAKRAGNDGLIVRGMADKDIEADMFLPFSPEQIKSAIGNRGTFDPENPDILFSRSAVREYTALAVNELNKTFSAPGKLNWWHKTVGTMYNLAQRSPAFKRVFEAAQGFVDDVSHYANDAAEMAPTILPKLDTWADILKQPISAADNAAISKPIFEGTLLWSRDEDGNPVRIADMEAEAESMTAEQKAERLVARGKLKPGILKMWQGMGQENFEKMVESRYQSQLLKPGIVWSDAELKSIFGLDDKQAGLYREFRAATNRSLDNMARADMMRFGGEDLKEIRDRVMDAEDLQDAAGVITSHLARLAKENPDREKQLMEISHGIMERAARVMELQAEGYAPLSRFGKYTVDVVDEEGRQYFGLFETKREANKMAERMREEFGADTVSQGTLSDEAYKLFAGITPESLELFGNMLGLDSTGDSAQDKAFQEYLRLTKTNRSAMKRLIHRQGIAGFSEDVPRVLASFIYSNARQTAAGLNIGELGDAINEIPKEQGELKDAAIRLGEYVKNPQEEAQAIRALLFAQYLGGSIASAMVNMTQPIAVSFPYLSQFGGAKKAAAQLGRAARDIAKRGFQYEQDLAEALKLAEEDGTVSPQEVHQLMAQAQGQGSLRSGDGTKAGEAIAQARNGLARLSIAWGKVFGMAEQANRRMTFIAAYRIAKEQGIPDPDGFARRAVIETQFIYSKANKMEWGRGAIGSTLMTFKTYSVAYLELLHRMYTQGGPEGKKAAMLALGMLMLLGGAGGLPFEEDLEDAADGLAQMLGYNISVKQARQEFLEDAFGSGIASFIESGISGLPGIPLDVSGRMGMGNLIPGTGLLQSKTDHTRDVLEIAGPAGDMASRFAKGAGKVLGGDIGGGLLEASPLAVRNAIKGVDMASTGMYRDQKGYKVLETNHLESAMKSIGFQPRSVARVQEANAINQQQKNFYNLRATEIRSLWAQGIFEGDQSKVEDARAQIADWNRKNPDQRMIITIPSVHRRVKEMRKSKDERIAATAPKSMRAQMREDIERRRLEQ